MYLRPSTLACPSRSFQEPESWLAGGRRDCFSRHGAPGSLSRTANYEGLCIRSSSRRLLLCYEFHTTDGLHEDEAAVAVTMVRSDRRSLALVDIGASGRFPPRRKTIEDTTEDESFVVTRIASFQWERVTSKQTTARSSMTLQLSGAHSRELQRIKIESDRSGICRAPESRRRQIHPS